MPTIEVSDETFKWLSSMAVPLVDTTDSVLQRVRHVIDKGHEFPTPIPRYKFGKNETNFTFSYITSGKCGNIDLTAQGCPLEWNNVFRFYLAELIRHNPLDRDAIIKATSFPVRHFKSDEPGFRYIPALDISTHGGEARRVVAEIGKIAAAASKPLQLSLNISWRHKDKIAIIEVDR
jgi:hypothetical protein